ncbi:MAG: hypothetical protein QOK08_446 [Actinomycetota bacterium]|nr:hypothetical protein [Actinomycetota bacterium]MDQ1573066.1 hypothetical protein [Actinomycetota bacterium]
MTDRIDQSRAGRGRTGTAPWSSSRFDQQTETGTDGLTNARTRIVGTRTGFLADVVVELVRVAGSFGVLARRFWLRLAAVVTPVGWTLIVVVPLAFVFGYVLGWVELITIAWAGGVLIVIALVYLIGRNPLAIQLRVAHSRIVVGEAAVGEVVVENPRPRRVLGASIEIPVGAGLAAVTTPSLRRGARFAHEFVIPTLRRGRITVGPVRTIRADPIGLVRRELVWTDPFEIFIHPRTIAIPSTSTGFVHDLEGNATRDLTNSDVSFHALREYQPGDERRYIHWKSSAKTGTYMVRQFEETRRSHIVIALSLARGDYATDDEFEMAVSVTGSLGVRAIRDARNISVVVSETTPDFAKRKVLAVRPLSTLTRARLLDDLAVVESGETALAITDVARVAAEQVAGISVAFLVCGSGATPSELRAASTKFPAGVEVVAIVCDPDSIPGLRKLAGLSVLTIGYLEDLQKSLARSAAA